MAKKNTSAPTFMDYLVGKATRLYLDFPRQYFYSMEWSYNKDTTAGIDMYISIDTNPTPHKIIRTANVSVYNAYSLHYSKGHQRADEVEYSNEILSERIKTSIEKLLN